MHFEVCRLTNTWNCLKNKGRYFFSGEGKSWGGWSGIRVMKGGVLLASPLASPSEPCVPLDKSQLHTVSHCAPLKDSRSVLSAKKGVQRHRKSCWLSLLQRPLTLQTVWTIPEEAEAAERWMMEQSRDCSSSRLKVRKEELTSPDVTCFCVSLSSPSQWDWWAATIYSC